MLKKCNYFDPEIRIGWEDMGGSSEYIRITVCMITLINNLTTKVRWCSLLVNPNLNPNIYAEFVTGGGNYNPIDEIKRGL